jgi:hypothetical protein
MPTNGKSVAVVNTGTHRVEALLNSGPRTNHPNFVTVGGVSYAYLTVGNLNETLVYRRTANGRPPVLVKRIPTCCGPEDISRAASGALAG